MSAWLQGYGTPPSLGISGAAASPPSSGFMGAKERTPLLGKRPPGSSNARLSRLLLLVQACCRFLLPCCIFIGTDMAFTLQSMVALAFLTPPLAIVVLAWAMRDALKAMWLTVMTIVGFGDESPSSTKASQNARLARDTWWHGILLATVILAWVWGAVLGNQNRDGAAPYFDFTSMGTYMEVDPLQASGRLLQDAGRILFSPGAKVDTSRAVGFRNTRTYCVAPVTMGDSEGTPAAYDFWVVGVDCCEGGSGEAARFQCGEIGNKRAAAGLRSLGSGDERAFWRLAVQEAEAAFQLRAEHPLFLHWMQDPVAKVNSYWANATRALFMQCVTACSVQLLLVLAALMALGKRPGGK